MERETTDPGLTINIINASLMLCLVRTAMTFNAVFGIPQMAMGSPEKHGECLRKKRTSAALQAPSLSRRMGNGGVDRAEVSASPYTFCLEKIYQQQDGPITPTGLHKVTCSATLTLHQRS